MYPKILLVMDFEATCDEPKPIHPPELIELPVIAVDTESHQIVNEFHSFIKPTIHPQLTNYCVELTGITQKDVAGAPTFAEGLILLQKWIDSNGYQDGLCMTCGDWDIDTLLRQQCLTMQVQMPAWAARWCNLKVAFKDFFRQISSDHLGIANMLEYCGLERVGQRNCGIDDARSLAQIVAHMLKLGAHVSANSNGHCPKCGVEVTLNSTSCPECNADWSNLAPGDWICPQCNTTNYSYRTSCFSCRRPRTNETISSAVSYEASDPHMKPGDWICPTCRKLNFARRNACMDCNTPRPASAAQSNGRSEMREGDWNCPDCGSSNFARRTSCFRCGASKPWESSPSRSHRSTPMNAADWICPSCGETNFARRSVCFRCDKPKPTNS